MNAMELIGLLERVEPHATIDAEVVQGYSKVHGQPVTVVILKADDEPLCEIEAED